jgi:hypothetical protein
MYLHIHVYTLTHTLANTLISCVSLQKKNFIYYCKNYSFRSLLMLNSSQEKKANVGLAPLQDLTNSTRCSPLWKVKTCSANQENYPPRENHYHDYESTPLISQSKSPSSGFKCVRKIMESGFVFVCLSVRMEQVGSHWTDFREIWYLNILRKSVENILIWLKCENNSRQFIQGCW